MHFIPGCMGSAVGGPDGCTCDYPLSAIEREREARRAADEYVAKLRSKAQRRQEFIESLMRTNKRLCAEIRRMKAVNEGER